MGEVISFYSNRTMVQSAQLNECARIYRAGVITGYLAITDQVISYRKAKVITLEDTHHLNASTHRLFMLTMVCAAEDNKRGGHLTMTELAATFGLKLSNGRSLQSKTKAALAQDCATLEGLCLHLPPTASKSEKAPRYVMALFKRFEVVRGAVEWAFTDDFSAYLKTCQHMPISDDLMRIDLNRYPYALSLGRYISEQHRMNGDRVISIKALLDVAYAAGLPTPDVVSLTNRHYFSRIIEPLLKNIASALGAATYELCGPKGAELTPDQAKRRFDFSVFKRLNLTIKRPFSAQAVEKKSASKREKKAV